MSDETDVLFEKRGHAGLITLNRPAAHNALTLGMIRKIHCRLTAWADDPDIGCTIIRAAGDKAFCAGGDIRQLHQWGLAGDAHAVAFYREEYRLNAFIKRYPKPFIALIDGIIMGGGFGVAIHGSHRLCAQRTVFAMPECGIGLFPDVGATYVLPRLPGSLGTYLALTGARLGQLDLLWCGLATHAVHRDRFEALLTDLAEGIDPEAACRRYASPPGQPALPGLMPAIDRCFSAGSVEEIHVRLRNETGEFAEWAARTDTDLRTKSPISLRIALRQMSEGKSADFEECLRIEFRIVNRVLEDSDFFEGVRAVIVDKDNRPQWSHKDIEAVPEAEVVRYFASLGGDELDFG